MHPHAKLKSSTNGKIHPGWVIIAILFLFHPFSITRLNAQCVGNKLDIATVIQELSWPQND
jgi:hypothetical protein